MKVEQRKQILKNHKLRITNCRLDVIEYFLSIKRALSLKDLELHLKSYDRVTIYRTLGSFLESGILHKIPGESGFATYGLCYQTCTPEIHTHNHIHFKCNSCGEIECLEGRSVPQVILPSTYQINGINVIVDGECTNCSGST